MKPSSVFSKLYCIQVIACSISAWLAFSELAGHEQAVEDGRRRRKRRHEGARLLQVINNRIDSPYEAMWPNSHLPSWAKKSTNYDVPRGKEVCFVHVGKAGGSAVGCSLGFSLHCRNKLHRHRRHHRRGLEVNGILPKITTHLFHKDVYNCLEDSAYFLFVVRDPIDRARSAFNYDRPENDDDGVEYLSEFYYDCPFYHFDDFVKNGLSEQGEASKSCKRLANGSLKGSLLHHPPGPSHWYYNYQYYYEAVPKDAPILVLRNEHLEEDWHKLESMLGGEEEDSPSFPRNNENTWSGEDDLYLSEESIAILCKVLCNEIQEHKKILRRAQNINEDQLQVSLIELETKCPMEAVFDECPEPLPDISVKLQENRGYYRMQEEEGES